MKNWTDINVVLSMKHPEIFDALAESYGSLDDLDVYIAGMLESDKDPGPLFRAVIREQFERIRDGDRFWFENAEAGVFTEEEVEWVRGVRLWDVIVNSTSVDPDEIQESVFFWTKGDPCAQPRQLRTQHMPPCEYLKGYDSFQVIIDWILFSFN